MASKKMTQMVQDKRNQWNKEAELFFCQHGKKGGEFERQLWANGQLMVAPKGSLPNQAIPFDRAVELFRAGWKIRS